MLFTHFRILNKLQLLDDTCLNNELNCTVPKIIIFVIAAFPPSY